jgi:hypothetical protein
MTPVGHPGTRRPRRPARRDRSYRAPSRYTGEEAIAAAIPAELAQQVADLLAARLAE